MKYFRSLLFATLILTPFSIWLVPSTAYAAGCYYYDARSGYNVPTNVQPNASGYCPSGPNGERGISLDGPTGAQGTVVPNNLSYTPLEPLPGQNTNQADFCQLLNLTFKTLIYLGGMVAVLFLVLGGITYMVSEVVDKKSSAKERIKAAVWGLILLLASWMILNTINPQLINACNILAPTSTGLYTTTESKKGVETQQLLSECTLMKGRELQPIPSSFATNPCGGLIKGSVMPSCKDAKIGTLCCDLIEAPTNDSSGKRCTGVGTNL